MHTQQILEAEPQAPHVPGEDATRGRHSLADGYYIFKVSMKSHNGVPVENAYVFSIGAKTSQEACEVYLGKTKPEFPCKISVKSNYGAEVIFTVTPVPSFIYSLSMEG